MQIKLTIRKTYIAVIFLTVVVQNIVSAQYSYKMQDVTEATFNLRESFIRHQHTVFLQNNNRMIIELQTVKSYELLKDFPIVLKSFRQSIEFYEDSLSNLSENSIRIDYATSIPEGYNKLRFKKYKPDGDIYVSRHGDVSMLKFKQDTVRLIVSHNDPSRITSSGILPLQVTFVLNDYSNIDDIISKAASIQQVIDTMAAIARPKKKQSDGWAYRTTIQYYPGPDYKSSNFQLYYSLPKNNMLPIFDKHQDRVSLSANIGAGLIKGKPSPFVEAGLEYRDYWVNGDKHYSVFGLYTSPYFLFKQRVDGSYRTYINWFINAELGMYGENEIMDLPLKRLTIGAGYLVNPDGVHFQKVSFKLFANLSLPRGITLSPEAYFTNNFNDIFPGITVKVF